MKASGKGDWEMWIPLVTLLKEKKKKRGNSLKTNSKPVKGHALPLNFIFAQWNLFPDNITEGEN